MYNIYERMNEIGQMGHKLNPNPLDKKPTGPTYTLTVVFLEWRERNTDMMVF